MEITFQIVKVFSFGLVIDLLWVFYTLSLVQNKKLHASLFSMVLALPALFGYFDMYDNRLLVIPYICGLGCGTYIALRIKDIKSSTG